MGVRRHMISRFKDLAKKYELREILQAQGSTTADIVFDDKVGKTTLRVTLEELAEIEKMRGKNANS